MTTIKVSYAALEAGHSGLVATWGRIESHLSDLDATVAATGDMEADTLDAYRTLQAQWDGAADDRQLVLRALADAVQQAGEQYRTVDTQLAAQFG
jgi:uncharacterized protein YukE